VIHLIGICGTAMATLAALLKRRGHDVRGSDQNVYPPMSDFLAAEGIPITTGYAADHIGSDVDLVVIGNAISRGNAELESVLERKIPLLFAPGSCSGALSVGCTVHRRCRYARKDDDHVADRVAADERPVGPDRARWRNCAEFRRRRFELPRRRRPRVRD
jgi:hypothetical protein